MLSLTNVVVCMLHISVEHLPLYTIYDALIDWLELGGRDSW
jgi:hypothetical protein